MIKSRFTKTEIVYAVKQVEAGVPVREVGRKYGVTEKTIYTWRNKYGGLSVSGLVCLGSTVVACFLLVTLAMWGLKTEPDPAVRKIFQPISGE